MRIFLILVSLLVPSLAKETAPSWSERGNICFDGKLSYKRQYAYRSAMNCQSYCEWDSRCIVGRYDIGKSYCYYYDTREVEEGKGCIRFGYAFSRVPEMKWIEHRDGCYSTKSYETYKTKTNEKDCRNFCAVESRCVTARFHPDTEKCYLASNNKIEVVPGKCWVKNIVYEKDIDECSVEKDICGKTATCINTFGSYNCVCIEGYIREGKTCKKEDIDECATKKHPCGKTAKCINTVGSYRCECKQGYSRHGKKCKKDKGKQQKHVKLSRGSHPEGGSSHGSGSRGSKSNSPGSNSLGSNAHSIHNFGHMTTVLGISLAYVLGQVYK